MTNKLALYAILLALITPAAQADSRDDEIRLLREQIQQLSARLDQLEQNSALAARAPQAAPAAPVGDQAELEARIDQAVAERVDEKMAGVSWAERLRWKGDFRYRYENIAVEGSDDRNRSRIRARAELEADISPTLQVGIGLASGSDDPLSTNQTLGSAGSTKDLGLDLAYFQWSGLSNTTVVGGKFKNLLFRPGKNGLLWDGDWNPEGTAFKYENGGLFVNGIGTWVESDSKALDQEFSFGLQGGFSLAFGDTLKLTAGAGYYQFDMAGKRSFFGNDDDFFGNSFDPESLTYLYDYQEIEAFAELGFKAFGRPALVFVDYVINLDPDDDDTAWALGLKYGSIKKQGDWEFAWVYQDVEADAVLGLISDSDFAGGGTNSRGSVFKGSYALQDNWTIQTTWFQNEILRGAREAVDFKRLQLDLNFKFK